MSDPTTEGRGLFAETAVVAIASKLLLEPRNRWHWRQSLCGDSSATTPSSMISPWSDTALQKTPNQQCPVAHCAMILALLPDSVQRRCPAADFGGPPLTKVLGSNVKHSLLVLLFRPTFSVACTRIILRFGGDFLAISDCQTASLHSLSVNSSLLAS